MDSPKLLDPKKRLDFSDRSFDRLTHYLFRYPAKFHPPVVRTLIEQYSTRGDYILDPFCGSGSLLVEAAVAGRNAVGCDLDPVAAFVSRVKTYRYDADRLIASSEVLWEGLSNSRRTEHEYYARRFQDISTEEMESAISNDSLWVPDIPNMLHWFRRYVIVDLARIRSAIVDLQVPNTHREFFLLCFASIVRASSNADPVPVSGLEVTSHMRRKEESGRTIDPFALFERALQKALVGVTDFMGSIDRNSNVSVAQRNAIELGDRLQMTFDAIVTSPPYHGAVDYYRRHKLEMFWLGLTESQEERLALMRGYLGRPSVPQRDVELLKGHELGVLANHWEARIRSSSTKRANAFRHYAVSMDLVFDQLARLLKDDAPIAMVVGHSKWNGAEIPTVDLFTELAGADFRLMDYYWYPVKNRYMSFRRRNGASIDKEHVLVMQKARTY